MGSRTMDTRNQSGRTVARHPVPGTVRQRKKRAQRRAAKAQARSKPAKHPQQKRARQVAVQPRQPTKPAKQPLRKRTFRKVARAQAPAKPVNKRRQKRAPELPAQTQKPSSPAEQMQQPEQKPAKDEAKQERLDYLKDGVVEWGSRRE